jgi:hypothetical protein
VIAVDCAPASRATVARHQRGRDLVELKSDVALLENKMLTAQTEIVTILRHLEVGTNATTPEE